MALPVLIQQAASFIIPMILSMWGSKKMSDEDASNVGKMIGTVAHLGGGIMAGGKLAGFAGKGMKALGLGKLPQKFPLKPLGGKSMGRGRTARRVLGHMKNKALPGVVTTSAALAPFLGPSFLQMANEPDVAALMEAMPQYPGGGQSAELALLRQLMGGESGGLRDQNIDLFNMLTGKDLIQ